MSIQVRVNLSNNMEKSKAFDTFHSEIDRIRNLLNKTVDRLVALQLGNVEFINIDAMKSRVKDNIEYFKDDIDCQQYSNMPIEGLIVGREVYLLEILCVVDERLISEKKYLELSTSIRQILNEFSVSYRNK